MAFDFPASPTNGQVYVPTGGPAYQWDGEKWRGGQPSGPVTEQFFDASGLANVDIAVPTWAKGCSIVGCIFPTASTNTYVLARYSLDGTTFMAGATDYRVSGPTHNSGTAGYTANAAGDTNAVTITNTGDQVGVPHLFDTTIQLVRGVQPSQILGMTKTFMRTYYSDPSGVHRTSWQGGYVNAALGSNMAIKAMRFYLFGSMAMAAGSFLLVKWHGDAAQVPISNAIPDAPNDGKPYGRLNGAWSEVHTQALADARYEPIDSAYTKAESDAAYVNVGGDTITGDLTIYRAATPTTGVVFLGNTGARYLYYDGTNYNMPGAGLVLGGLMTANAGIISVGASNNTTATTANTVISTPAGNFYRSTSSLAYKIDIEPLWDSIGDLVLKMKPIFYRSDPDKTVDAPELSWYSFGVEDLAALDPRFGNNEAIQTNAVVAALVNLVQRLERRVTELEAR